MQPLGTFYQILNNHQDGHIRTNKEQTVRHVLSQSNVQIPGQLPSGDITKLQNRIKEEQSTVSTVTRNIEVLNENIKQEASAPTAVRAFKTALRVTGTALLVLSYALLAATLVGILVIAGFQCNDTFAKVCHGRDQVQLNDEQKKLLEAKTNEAALTEFKKALPKAIEKSEADIAACDAENKKIIAAFDVSIPKWLDAIRINSIGIRENQTALELMKLAIAE